MTRTTNARIAGVTFLVYIAAGITSLVVFGRAANGEGVAARLGTIAHHSADIGVIVILGLLQAFSALVLAVTLYAITREQDPDLAMLGLTCRVTEGVIGGSSIPNTLALLALATAGATNASETGATHVLAAYLLRSDVAVTATFFAVGSALFAYLLLRGRMIPVLLAGLGVVASVLLVVGLPLQAAGFLHGPVTSVMWLPMLAFEVPLAGWLIIKGVALPATARGAAASGSGSALP